MLGASGGIGSQVAKLLHQQQRPLYLAARQSDRLTSLANELDVPWGTVDATDIEQVDNCFEQATSEIGTLGGVVNCVGSILLKPAHLTSGDDWHETLSLNLTSAFATTRGAANHMTEGGSVVLISSAAACIGLANHEAIAAAKAGVIGLARSAAASYSSRNLRFNTVSPGLVKTGLTKKIWSSERAANTSKAMHPLGRLGEPEDIASLIVWLLDPQNDWISGENITLDGGLSGMKLH